MAERWTPPCSTRSTCISRRSPSSTWATPPPWPGCCSSSAASLSGCCTCRRENGSITKAEGNDVTSANIRKKRVVYVKTAIAAVLAVFMLYPLIWMLSSSFKPQNLIFRDLSLWPSAFTLEIYVNGWRGISNITFATFFKNSFLIVLFCILGNLLTCSVAAYAFARIRFKGRGLWFALMFASLLLPHHVVLIPQYLLFNSLNWVDTYMPLIVPKFLAHDAFFIFLMVQFI